MPIEPWQRPLVVVTAAVLAILAAPVAAHATGARPVPADLEMLGDRAARAVPGRSNQPFIDQALSLADKYRRAKDARSEARAYQLAGYFSMLTDDNAASAGYSDRALDICRKNGDLPCVTRTAINSAVAHKRAEQLSIALDRLQLAIAVARRTGETDRAEQARYNLANVQHEMGDPIGALATFDQLARDYPDSETALGSLLTAARIHVELGQSAPALAKARAALALLNRDDARGWTVDATTTAESTAGLAYALAGDQMRAIDHLDRAMRRAQRSDSDEERFDVNDRYAWGWQLLDRPDRALPYARVAFALRATIEERDRLGFLERAADVFERNGDDRSASAARGEALSIRRRLQGAALQQATATAAASIGIGERNLLIDKLQLDRAEERAALDRTRLIAVTLIAALLLIAVLIVARLRLDQMRRQQAAVLDERTRVARDLHDTLIQGFTGITLQLQQAARAAPEDRRANNLSRTAAASLMEARNAVWQMRSDAVERGDLRAAIHGWLAILGDEGDRIAVSLGDLPQKLSRDITENMLRFVQEAVTNALHHADADHIAVQASRPSSTSFELAISDNGRGFDPDEIADGHWGLVGMRERVERLGGTFSLISRPGKGTRVAATVNI